jgi:hypothetical protein
MQCSSRISKCHSALKAFITSDLIINLHELRGEPVWSRRFVRRKRTDYSPNLLLCEPSPQLLKIGQRQLKRLQIDVVGAGGRCPQDDVEIAENHYGLLLLIG